MGKDKERVMGFTPPFLYEYPSSNVFIWLSACHPAKTRRWYILKTGLLVTSVVCYWAAMQTCILAEKKNPESFNGWIDRLS